SDQRQFKPAARAMSGAGAHGDEDIDAGGYDDERNDDAERPRVDMGGGDRAQEAEDHRADAYRDGDFPVDAAAALIEPRAEDAGEQKRKKRGGGRLVDREATEEGEEGDHHHAADTDRADQQTDQRGDGGEDEAGDQPAAKATSSLVSRTASFFS